MSNAQPAAANGNGQQVAVLHPPRLPYHPLIEERFGVDKASWKALTEAIYPNAKTTDAVVMALSYCRARKLDPFKRPVHIVPMWSAATRGYVETVWPGISEIRTTAFRTGQYSGKDETEFGPMQEQKFSGRVGNDERETVVKFPEWGRMKIKRNLQGVECVFVSPKVYWLETYGRIGASSLPNDMWAKRPIGQFEKCVEAAALRCAFPEEVGNDLTAEEMEGRTIEHVGDAAQQRAIEARPTLSNALDELARAPGAAVSAEPEVIEVSETVTQDEIEAANALGEPVEDERHEPDAGTTPKRPPRIDLEIALKATKDVRGVLTFLQENATAIGALPKEDRRLFDTAVLKHQDDLKKASKD